MDEKRGISRGGPLRDLADLFHHVILGPQGPILTHHRILTIL